MVRGSQGTRFTGSALIRLLAQLVDTDVAESKQAVAERLGHWLDWTGAISLSTALDATRTEKPDRRSGVSAHAEEQEFTRVRSALANAIAEEDPFKDASAHVNQPAPAGEPQMAAGADFSPLRRRYIARQQAMEAGIGALRSRVRAAAASASPHMARLAAMDAVMDQVLGARERTLLSTLPVLLGQHYERLRRSHEETPPDTQEQDEPDRSFLRGGWLDVFCKDMQAVLLAELNLRLQPVEGLLEALRASEPRQHE